MSEKANFVKRNANAIHKYNSALIVGRKLLRADSQQFSIYVVMS